MNELTPIKEFKPSGAKSTDSAMLRGLCAGLNSGFTAPGGADANTQKEIRDSLKGDASFKQEAPRTRSNIPAKNSAPAQRAGEGATLPPTALPTQEAVDEVIIRRPNLPVATKRPEQEQEPEPEPEQDYEDVDQIPLEAAAEEHEADTEDAPYQERGEVGKPNPKYRKVVFTGQMKSGKDYCAKAGEYQILSLAAPLYALLEFFFGVTEEQKDLPGCRQFMQIVGTWGRGDVSSKEPLTPERAVFIRMIQTMGEHELLPMGDVVDWKNFGRNKNIWLDACLKRADAILEGSEYSKVAVVNGRFENEIKAFDDAGWARFHVMASPLALRQRREKDNVPAASLQHPSESLAMALDKGSIAVARKTKKERINVIWNDPQAGRPSSKFYTVREFAATVNTIE